MECHVQVSPVISRPVPIQLCILGMGRGNPALIAHSQRMKQLIRRSALSRENDTKPLVIVTGANDAIFCGGNCSITSLGANITQLDTTKGLFPGLATVYFSTVVIPDTRHGIDFRELA